jgi:hypothetical protein
MAYHRITKRPDPDWIEPTIVIEGTEKVKYVKVDVGDKRVKIIEDKYKVKSEKVDNSLIGKHITDKVKKAKEPKEPKGGKK